MGITGFATAGYGAARDAFEALFAEGAETGAGLVVWKNGRCVLRLSGGFRDTSTSQPWTDDTMAMSYSASKPFVALAALWATAEGLIELDVPVARYWPEFAERGKSGITVRHVLTHTAGMPAFPDDLADVAVFDNAGLRSALAQAKAESPPGRVLAEHAATYGHLIDGVLLGATGRSLEQIWHDTLRPALDIDAWFGVPDSSLWRVADLEYGHRQGAEGFLATLGAKYRHALTRPEGLLDVGLLNSVAWRRHTFGAISMHASATALAQFYDQLTRASGPVASLIGTKLAREFVTTQVQAIDRVVELPLGWTPGLLQTKNFIGLGGLGGSAAWWSHRHDHGVAYVTRRLLDHKRVGKVAAALGDDITTALDAADVPRRAVMGRG